MTNTNNIVLPIFYKNYGPLRWWVKWSMSSFCCDVLILLCIVYHHPASGIGIPTNILCHYLTLPTMIVICPLPPFVSVYHYSIHSTVFDLVPSSIMGSSTWSRHTCLFGYCIQLKLTIVHVMKNVIYLIPPLSTLKDLVNR